MFFGVAREKWESVGKKTMFELITFSRHVFSFFTPTTTHGACTFRHFFSLFFIFISLLSFSTFQQHNNHVLLRRQFRLNLRRWRLRWLLLLRRRLRRLLQWRNLPPTRLHGQPRPRPHHHRLCPPAAHPLREGLLHRASRCQGPSRVRGSGLEGLKADRGDGDGRSQALFDV